MTRYQQLSDSERKELQSKLFDAISKSDICYGKVLEVIKIARLLGVYEGTTYGVSIYQQKKENV